MKAGTHKSVGACFHFTYVDLIKYEKSLLYLHTFRNL